MAAEPLAVDKGRTKAGSVERFLAWLFSELSPFPGRDVATLRMVLACLAVVTISMALQVPQGALSAFLVFFCSKEDVATTTATAIVVLVAVTAGFALTIPALLVTVDHPAVRLALMTAVFCAGMYLSRVFAIGPLAWAVGFIVLVSQQFVDLYPDPETLVRFNLWTWVALALPVVVVWVANLVILPSHPIVLLRLEAKRRMAFVIEALDRRLAGLPLDSAAPFDAKVIGSARLLALLKLSASGAPALKEKLASYTSIVNVLNRMVETACMLSALEPAADPAQLRIRIAALRSACDDLRRCLDSDLSKFRAPLELRGSIDDAARVGPILEEMGRYLTQIAGELEKSSSPSEAPAAAPPSASKHLFVSDALTNPVYLQFAVKTTCAAMLCYIAYTVFDWPGIHTCAITCTIIALGSAGATINKAALRLTGALIGGGLAILATVFVIPHLDSIGGLLLLIAPVAALSAWIASGSERIAYCGWQIAFAFFLCVLHGYEPNSDVTIVRDRLVGIVFGIGMMAVMFNYVWPERAGQQMRAALAKAIRAAASLLQSHHASTSDVVAPSIAAERAVIFESLVLAQRMAEVTLFEPPQPDAAKRGGEDAELVAASQATAISALEVAQLRERNAKDANPLRAHALKALDDAVGEVLQKTASRLEQDPPDGDGPAPAARLLRLDKQHLDALKALDTKSSRDIVNAYRELIGRVGWLSSELA
jgi:multidrug resistance protein MdtO